MQLFFQSKAQAKLDSASLHHKRPTLASNQRAVQMQKQLQLRHNKEKNASAAKSEPS
jgi:hypothetical protein